MIIKIPRKVDKELHRIKTEDKRKTEEENFTSKPPCFSIRDKELINKRRDLIKHAKPP